MQGSALGFVVVGGGAGSAQMTRTVSPHEGADREKQAEESPL